MKGLQSIDFPPPQKLKGIVLVCLLIGTLAIVGLVSFDKLWTIQKRHLQIQDTIGLERQVSQLRSHYLQANPEALDTDLQEAERHLIQNLTELAQWAQRLQGEGKQWNLLIQYRILNRDRTASSIPGVVMVPLEIHVLPQGPQSAYRPCLQFIKTLTRSGPRVDIRNMTVIGDGQKATHLTIGLSVWMKAIDSVEL